MPARKEVLIGERGISKPTHCYVTGRPLGDAPVNYSLGCGFYVSVNNGAYVSTEELNKLALELGSKVPHETIVNLDFEEVIGYDD